MGLEAAAIVAQSEDVKTLTVEVNALHRRAEELGQQALKEIRFAGERLIKIKSKTAHGEWLPYIEKKFNFSARTAMRYMRIAREWKEVSKCKTITEAFTFLTRSVGEECEPEGGDAKEPETKNDTPVVYCRRCRTTGVRPNCKGCEQFRQQKAVEEESDRGAEEAYNNGRGRTRKTTHVSFSWDDYEASFGRVVRSVDVFVEKHPEVRQTGEQKQIEGHLRAIADINQAWREKYGE